MLRLPRFSNKADEGVVALPSPDALPADATVILMVEDEPAVRGLFAQALRREGYCVLEARNGAEALEVVAHAGHVDLVISDVVMPIMKGPELATKLREENPDLRFIFVSGYLVEEPLGPNAVMLQKPFMRNDLMKLVFDTVGPPRAAAS